MLTTQSTDYRLIENDFRLYHDGTNSNIVNTTNVLTLYKVIDIRLLNKWC